MTNPLPILDCEHVGDDGCCTSQKNITAECHVFICPRISPVVKRIAEAASAAIHPFPPDDSMFALSCAVSDAGGP